MKNLVVSSMFVVLVPIFAACSSGDFAVGTDQSAAKGSPGVDGGACVTDSDCPAESACGYAAAEKCTATGACYQFSGSQCASYIPGCACDGTEINIGCTPYPVGYFSKPLLHDGACSTGGGAQDASTGGPCDTDSDCAATGQICGFLISEACSAHGTCVTKNTGPTCALFEPACTCDGQLTGIACTDYPSGYANAPIAHTGECDSDGGSFAADAGK
jgi:hypothetical protein